MHRKPIYPHTLTVL